MNGVLTSVGSVFESVLKLGASALKCSIAIGSVCVMLYALRVGHFPKGLTLGDGLLFFLAAGCFGIVYTIFSVSLTCLGIVLSPLIRLIFKCVVWVTRRFYPNSKPKPFEWAKFRWPAVLFGLPAVAFIYVFGKQQPVLYLNLICLSIMMYFLYSMAKSTGAEYRRMERTLISPIETNEKTKLLASDKALRQKNVYIMLLAFLALTPLALGGVSGLLMDGAMRLAHIRVENSLVYVKSPYSDVLPVTLAATEAKQVSGYKAFSEVTVEFQGFGSSTVISFKDGKSRHQIDVPNDSILIQSELK